MSPIQLTQMKVGQSGELAKSGEADAPRRLLDLGFVEGTKVTLVRCGPFGDPMELELRGYRICLRRRDVAGVRVVLMDAQS